MIDDATALRAVLKRTPDLNGAGFRFPGQRVAHAESRDEIIGYPDEFRRAVEYLEQCKRRKTVNRAVTSYGWKHDAEEYHRQQHSGGNCYICATAYSSRRRSTSASQSNGFPASLIAGSTSRTLVCNVA